MRLTLLLSLVLLSIPTSSIAQQRPSLTRAQTRDAEQLLFDMGYWTGAVDGVFDKASQSALIAFQKWEGRPITGQFTLAELEAIRTSSQLDARKRWPKARDIGYAHVEVDLDRQVLIIVNAEGIVRVLPVSTGNDKPFIDEGQESISYTPRGRFIVYAKEVGWQTGSLGATYYANFISGGVAIHGSRNVPSQPASHGCIRVPMFAAREVSKLMKLGTIVLVYDKVSFVSAKDWIANPQLKQGAIAISAANDETVYRNSAKATAKSIAIRKARARLIRAD